MRKRSRSRKVSSIAAVLMCLALAVTNIAPTAAKAADISGLKIQRTDISGAPAETGGTGNQNAGEGESAVDTSGMTQGADADIAITGVSIPANTEAGGKVTVSFTVEGKKNSANGKEYNTSVIQKVCPVIDESFPFVTDNAAYAVTEGTGNKLACTYTFTTKDTLETGYYPVSFVIVYSRKSVAGADLFKDEKYFVNKSFSVKIKAKPEATTEAATEAEAAEGDITMSVKKAPVGSYGKKCAFSFTVKSDKCSIISVAPVINETFPFETNEDAYKTVSSKGTKKLECSYAFKVREDVATGYQPVSFTVTYIKDKKTCTATKTINVKTTGKKEEASTAEGAGPISTPRLMVTGYETDITKIAPNSTFKLTLHMQNTSKQVISNIKVSLSTAEGEFLPVSGASTAYIESIGAGKSTDIVMDMKAASGLSNKPYQIVVKSEYEDSKANPFSSEDSVSIPVTLEDRISLTEVMPPDSLTVGGSSEVSFTINNMGGTNLSNVTVKCEGEDFTCEESFVGNIASGTSSYASVVLNGAKVTGGDGKCKIIVTYENTEGATKSIEEETYVYVSEEIIDVEDVMSQDAAKEKQNKKGKQGLYVVLGIGAALVVIGIFVIRRKKRLEREEEELMDDDVL